MLQGLIYALLSAAAFGSMAILVKLGYLAGMTGAVMMQFRFSFAVLFLLVFLALRDRSQLRIPLLDLGKCAFLGLVVYWMQTTCFVSALATIPAATTSLILYGHPILVALLAALFLKMRINRVVIFSLVLVMIGCCLVFYDAFLREVDGVGLAYAFGAMATFSIYMILVQKLLRNIKPLTATFYVMLFATVSFTLSGDITAWLHSNREQIMLGFAMGLFPGVVAVTLLFIAIEKIGSAYTCIFSSVEPVVTLLGAMAFLDEKVVLLQFAGAVLIIAGIAVPNLRYGKKYV
ncbi:MULTISPECIES: DMT family transporter [unclassified Pseudodesulfovibrio]|uniref:DMT family transporter n=1 Tax=unclassified Pseudodesulfovibrio TaxID=2661612 RepID=UPI000FEB7637|nr:MULTISPECIES: DMT family transporter [unclassified Pseudodesulfovibrio]MCJ2164945.1 DMT family transporter [Pseudodesulfovibrio sp. S3-i]RWU03610.1 DMT family transporter [Pseudodesulfovibrio sp. S3]